MSSKGNQDIRIDGTVASGFESVRSLYAQNMRTLEERNTQLCVYYKGECVVDLWASAVGDDAFSADSLVNVFSSGKSLESIALASLVGKGQLDLQAKISHYWPEFAENGKQDLTVADLMRHEVGLAAFNTSISPEDLSIEGIKQNRIGRVIEAHPPTFPKRSDSRREYHAITRGWIANEIFRRIDSAGRTMGEYFREEISAPLDADVFIGLREPELSRVSRVVQLGFGFQFIQSLLPRFLGRRIEHNIFQIIARILRILPGIRYATVRNAPPPYVGMKKIAFFNERTVAMGETPSAAANCTARGLAKLAALIAAGGRWGVSEFIPPSAVEAIHTDPRFADMSIMKTTFSQGGVNQFVDVGASASAFERGLNEGREGFWGWMGLGGSIFQWHREHEIGFGYVPTSLNVLDLMNERGKAYQREVLRCVDALKTG
jgi:CubicO group peptidase (beta-lactamase class C family)